MKFRVGVLGVALAMVLCACDDDDDHPATGDGGIIGDSGVLVTPATLSVGFNPTLETGQHALVTEITKAELLNGSGQVVSTASVAGGVASFALSGVPTGDYFIRLNDLANDLLPVRLAAADTTELVNTSLDEAVVGQITDPTYTIFTLTQGRGRSRSCGIPTGPTSRAATSPGGSPRSRRRRRSTRPRCSAPALPSTPIRARQPTRIRSRPGS